MNEKLQNNMRLLNIMLEHLDRLFKIFSTTTGLCLLIIDLKTTELINEKEFNQLKKYLQLTLPAQTTNGYCWKMGSVKPRKKWLIDEIQRLQEELNLNTLN